ncbi:MAG: pantetheine-phosphate adenylyltransferase [Bacteroidales bacterium]|jgi:pantetheine-phosphate adenylyltransferase
MKRKIAVFPGSFDPITKGHENIILRSLELFDKVIVGVGVNIDKRYVFSVDQRRKWIEETFVDYPQVSSEIYEGLTVDFCKAMGASVIIRGLRTAADFEFERIVGQVNKQLYPEIETVFLLTSPEYSWLNSSIVRDILINGGDISMFIPDKINITADDIQA